MVTRRAPLAPSGCPIAIAPPFGFTYGASKIGKAWQQQVAASVPTQYTDPTATIARPWQIVVVFRFRRPKRPKYLWPAHADIDKLGRATVDGLVDAGLLSDDRHVTGLYLRKEFAEPGEPEGALIEVWR